MFLEVHASYMTASLAGVEFETLVSEPDALTTRPSYTLRTTLENVSTQVQCRAMIYSLSELYYLWYFAKCQIKFLICGTFGTLLNTKSNRGRSSCAVRNGIVANSLI